MARSHGDLAGAIARLEQVDERVRRLGLGAEPGARAIEGLALMLFRARRWTEVYEERIGLLQAVNPSILGVQIAYGGYIAYNTLKPTAFCKVTNAT